MCKKLKSTWEDNTNLIKNILASGGIKGLAVLINMLTTPAYMRYFSDQNILGVWLTLISVLTTVSVLDFGLGNGLRNKLTESIAQNDRNRVCGLISSSYAIIFCFSLIIALSGIGLLGILPWNRILGIAEDLITEEILIKIIKIVFVGIVVQLVLKLITSILYAQQKAALVSLLPVITNTVMLLYVEIIPGSGPEQNLLRLAILYCVACNIPYLLATILLFCGKLRYCRPRFKYVNFKVAKSVLKLGILFFYLSVMSMLVHNTNEILISALFHSTMVVEYQIYNKVFYLITTVLNVLMLPLWSAVTKALAQNNINWMKRIHNILCLTSVLAFIGGLMLIPVMQFIVDVWLGENAIVINKWYCIPFVIYIAEAALNGANATIANGANWIKAQIIMAPVGVLLIIPVTIVLSKLCGNWLAVQIANIISLLPIAVVQFIYIRRKFRIMEQKTA